MIYSATTDLGESSEKVCVSDFASFQSLYTAVCLADDEKVEGEAESETPKVDEDVGKSRDGSKTDDEAIEREEEAIKLDGLNVAQMKEIRERAEKFAFQAEVSRMMKLIINSLYRNKEVRSIGYPNKYFVPSYIEEECLKQVTGVLALLVVL